MFKKIIIALLIGLILVPSVNAVYKGEVYDYQGYHRREKVNYSLIDSDNFTGGNMTLSGNATASWWRGFFDWTEDSPYLSWTGSVLSFAESLMNTTIIDLINRNPTGNTTAELTSFLNANRTGGDVYFEGLITKNIDVSSKYYLGGNEILSGVTDIKFGDIEGIYLPLGFYTDSLERMNIGARGDVNISKTLNVAENVTADYYFGDASQMTNAGNLSWNQSYANSLYCLLTGCNITGSLQVAGQTLIGGVTQISTTGTWDVGSAEVGHWKMNDNLATTNVIDSSVNSYNGTSTVNTDTQTVAGKINTALEFNGVSEDVTTGWTPNFNPSVTSYSISAWAKANDKGAYHMVWGTSLGSSQRFYLAADSITDEKWKFIVKGGAVTSSLAAIDYGVWTHIVITIGDDDHFFRMYINGVYQSVGGLSSFTTTGPFAIGAQGAGGFNFDGQIDDVRVFDRELTQAEIDGLYNAGSGTEEDDDAGISEMHAVGTTAEIISLYLSNSKKNQYIEGSCEIGENLYTIGNTTSDYFKGNMDWTNLTGYPVACPAPTAITQLGDSITCTSYQTGNTTAELTSFLNANRTGGDVAFNKNIILDVGSFIGSGLRTSNMSGGYGIPVGTLSLVGGSKTTHYGGIGGGGGKISLQGGRGRDASNDPSNYAPILLQSNGGNVGIGTTSPEQRLEIYSNPSVLRLRDTGATASATTAYVEFGGTDATAWNRTGFVGDGASANKDIYLQAEVSDLHLGDSSSATVLTLSEGDATFSGNIIGDGSSLTNLNLVNSNFTEMLNTNRTEGNVDFTYNVSSDYCRCNGSELIDLNRSILEEEFDRKILENRSANVSFYENIGVDTGSCIKVEGTCEMDFITGRLDIPNRIRSLVRFDAFGQWNLYNNVVMYFREAAAIVAVLRHHTAFDQMTFGVTHRSDHQLILTTYDNTILNHDRPDRDNPWFYVFSNTSVDVDNSQWIGISHNKSDAIIESGKGSIYLRNNIIGAGNITSENLFIPQDIFSHTNRTIQVLGANTWTNVTFDQEVAEIKFGIIHNADDDTNQTFTVSMDGVYFGDYDFDIEDNSVSASDIDIAGRLIYVNGTEVVGSDFEAGIEKNGVEKELSHDFLFNARAGDSFIFQFVGSDADVQISTHGTFGDHPESASIIIKKERNL